MANEPGDAQRSARAFLARLARVALEEVTPVRPRKIVAEVAAGLLPQQTFNRTRTAMLRAAGVRIGKQSLILGPVRLTGNGDPCAQLTIGTYTLITGPLHADLGAAITIGNNVRMGHNVSLLTISHVVGAEWLRSGSQLAQPIHIGDGAWLASNVTVLAGVTVGAGAIVAAGSVVTRDVPPNTMVAGVPAKVRKQLPADEA